MNGEADFVIVVGEKYPSASSSAENDADLESLRHVCQTSSCVKLVRIFFSLENQTKLFVASFWFSSLDFKQTRTSSSPLLSQSGFAAF